MDTVWFIVKITSLLFGVFLVFKAITPNPKNQPAKKRKLTVIERFGIFLMGSIIAFAGWANLVFTSPQPVQAIASPAPTVNPTPETSEPQKPIAAVAPKTPTATQKFVDTVALLIANPNAVQPVNRYTDKDGTLYEYEIPGANNFIMTRKKNRAKAWKIQFEPDGISPEKFGKLKDAYSARMLEGYSIASGKLKGHYLEKWTYADGSGETILASQEWGLVEAGWLQTHLIEQGLVPGVQSINSATLMAQCETYVRENLDAPSTAKFAGWLEKAEGTITKMGEKTLYRSWVDAQNTFGQEERREFKCLYDGRKNTLNLEWVEQ
jgi:hypothetical protein